MVILDDADRDVGGPMSKATRCGKHRRGPVDCLSHHTHQDRSGASIAPTHGRFDGAARRAQPATVSHDPSARGHRLRRALNGSTALVAVALVGTLLVATPPASAGGGAGGASGVHSNGRGAGGSGGYK